MSICRRSIARRVSFLIFVFSLMRSLYLPFMYEKNCQGGYEQRKIKLLDLYEFIVGLALPYTIIFVANISLIFSLNKQNNLMHSTKTSTTTAMPTHNNNFHINNGITLKSKGNSGVTSNGIYHVRRQISPPKTFSSPMHQQQQKQLTTMRHPNLRSLRNSINTKPTAVDGGETEEEMETRSFMPASATPLAAVSSNSAASSTSPTSLYHRTSNMREVKRNFFLNQSNMSENFRVA